MSERERIDDFDGINDNDESCLLDFEKNPESTKPPKTKTESVPVVVVEELKAAEPEEEKLPGVLPVENVYPDEKPNLEFVMPGFLKSTLGVLASPGGAGKSYFALSLGASLATGENLVDIPQLSQAKVLYYSYEDDPRIIGFRNYKLLNILPDEKQQLLKENMKFVCAGGVPGMRLCHGSRGSIIRNRQALDHITKQIESTNSDFVIFDTLTRIHTLNENANDEMSYVLAALETLIKRTGCTILLLHHISKAAKKEGGLDASASRGASAIIDNSRFCVALQKKENGLLELVNTKANYSQQSSEVLLTQEHEGVMLGVDYYKKHLSPFSSVPRPKAAQEQEEKTLTEMLAEAEGKTEESESSLFDDVPF